MKICSVCKIEKHKTDFHKMTAGKDGLCGMCKPCRNANMRTWAAANQDKVKKIAAKAYQKNKETNSARMVRWRIENKEKQREYFKAFERDPVKEKARAKKYKSTHKESEMEYRAKYVAENRERILARSREYTKNNPEKNAEKSRRRFAVKRNATPSWANKSKILEIYSEARRRTKETGILHHVDHCVPLKHPLVQGFHCEANLQILKHDENERKSNRHWPDMP